MANTKIYTIQELLNLSYDPTNQLLNVTSSSGTETTDKTVQDVLNKSFDDSANAIKTSQ
jgi:hypothetical protein